jgi:hypothetical protein
MTMPNDNQTTSESPSCDAACSVIFFSFRGASGEMEHHAIIASDAASLLSRTMGELEALKAWIAQMPNSPQNDQVDLTGDAGGPNSKKDVVAG